MRAIIIAATAALVAVPIAAAAPEDVNAETFYVNASQLMAKGMGAMLNSRTRPMITQIKAAATKVKAENAAATAKGKPLYCPPADSAKKGMGAQELVTKLGRLPQSQRKTSTLRQAWRAVLVRDYPCS